MRSAVRAIVIKDEQLLVMHRNKFGTEYDTLPGGGIELGEEPIHALVREIDEETTIAVANPRLVFIEHAGNPYGDQFIFLCDYVSGEPKLMPGGEEDLINKLGQNLYEPKWIPLKDLSDLPFVSERLKQEIISSVKTGFGDKVLEF